MYHCACICNLVDANATSIDSQGKVKPGTRASSQYITCECNKNQNCRPVIIFMLLNYTELNFENVYVSSGL